jgi:hypothetical protein
VLEDGNPAGERGAGEAFDLAVYLLRFRAEVTSPLRLPAAAGAALRGALFGALRGRFCAAGGGPGCGQAPVAEDCPVCCLLAPREQGHRRGQDVPRPYVLRVAPGAPLTYTLGQTFEFTLAICGRALGVFPYALLGIQEVGERGLGAERAGRFRLSEVWAENPLAGRQERVYRAADGVVATPGLAVGASDVAAEAARLSGVSSQVSAISRQLSAVSYQASAFSYPPAEGGGAQSEVPVDRDGCQPGRAQPAAPLHDRAPRSTVRLMLRTPTRLVEGGRLVKPAGFEVQALLARLLERIDALGARYGAGPTGVELAGLLEATEGVRIVERRLVWRDLFRGSGRHGRQLPMGGLVGEVVLEGDLAPLLPWLVWGSLVHVGKDAAMGNGLLGVEVV